MIKYKRIFLKELKILLSYFIKFKKANIILSKKYSNNCIIRTLDQQSIIIIIYNKIILFTSNNYHKIEIFEKYKIFFLKKKLEYNSVKFSFFIILA